MNELNHLNVTINISSDSILLTVPEMAKYLGVGRNLAYKLLQNGSIKGFRLGHAWKVTKAAVDLFLLKESGLG